MMVRVNEVLISEILKSPGAPALVSRIKSVLDKEKEQREIFYNQITEQEKAEFINGEIIVHSPVRKAHIQISLNLIKIIGTYVTENDLGFVGFEKTLIQFTRNDYEPDLCFFKKEVAENFKKDQALFPIPHFIVEILSNSTENRDRGIKYEDYQNHGVEEYWIIDPKSDTIEQYVLNASGNYSLVQKSGSGEISSIAIDNLVIPIKALFDEQLAHQFVRGIYQK